ncbi:FAD-dependent oxidoreductase [Frateuria aurantia]
MTPSLDLIVVGAGSGGVAAARRAAQHGARVAIVEQGRIGGTCVLRGCVPKKLLMYASRHGATLTEARDFGWQGLGRPAFSMAHWAQAKSAEIGRLEQVYRQRLEDSGVLLVQGRARLRAPGIVEVGARLMEAPRVLLATGAATDHSIIPGGEHAAGSDEVLDLEELPSRLTILGAGYIAVEFASILAGLGCRIDMRYRGELPLRGFDLDLRQRIATSLQHQGVELHPSGLPGRVEAGRNGWQLHFDDHSEATPYLLTALGRRPNTEGLGLDSLGLQLPAGAGIPVDEGLQTPIPGVYALGDVTHRKDLTPVAIAQGRWLADHLFSAGAGPAPSLRHVPTAIFSLTPAASIGLREDECPPGSSVYESEFRPMRLTLGASTERCYLKVLAAPGSQQILGIHMHGSDAPEIIQALAIAVTAGLAKPDLDRTMALHPTTAEEFVLLGQAARHVE